MYNEVGWLRVGDQYECLVNLYVLWMGGVGVIIFLLLYLSERAWELRGKGPMGP